MQNNKTEKEQGKRVVLDLMKDLPAGFDITTDNFYTSLKLAQKLLEDDKTLTGTMRQNGKEVPQEMLPNNEREVHSSTFLHIKEATMVSYVPKPKKAVVLLSTQHLGNFFYKYLYKYFVF